VDILVDTNILVHLANYQDSQHVGAMDAYVRLLEGGHRLFVTTQVLREFWVACTRPLEVGGMGLTAELAEQALFDVEAAFFRVEDSDRVYSKWRELVAVYSVLGKQVHDANLAASMIVNGLTHILTFNGKDFARFKEITVLDPKSISQL
jgi:predicted nucleic acid-binding protein